MADNWLLVVFLILGTLCLSIATGFLKDWLKGIFKKPRQIATVGAILFISGAIITSFVNVAKNKNTKVLELGEEIEDIQSSKGSNCIFPKNHLQIEGIKGNVLSVKTQKFDAVLANDKVLKTGKNEYGLLNNNSVLKFNKNGMITEALYYNDTTASLSRKEIYEFNKENCPISVKIFDNDKLSWSEKIEYDYKKLAVILFRFDSKGELEGKSMTIFGKYGEKEVILFDEHGKVKEKSVYQYNDQGERTIALDYDKDSKLIKADTIKYDYDLNSMVTSFNFYDGKTIITEIRDKNNLMIEKYTESRDHNYKEAYSYEFDKKGNWTKKLEFRDGRLISTTERAFTYY